MFKQYFLHVPEIRFHVQQTQFKNTIKNVEQPWNSKHVIQHETHDIHEEHEKQDKHINHETNTTYHMFTHIQCVVLYESTIQPYIIFNYSYGC